MAFLNKVIGKVRKWLAWNTRQLPGSMLSMRVAIAIFIIDVLVGITGLMWLEDFDLIDAFYQTVITISTVGFTEVKRLDDPGQIFVSF